MTRTPAVMETREDGFWAATETVMHFINSLDSSGMDANAVRSAIYHKCLEMRPADTRTPAEPLPRKRPKRGWKEATPGSKY